MEQTKPKQPAQQSEHVQQQMPQQWPKPWGSNWGSSQSVPHYEMHVPQESHTLERSREWFERQPWQRREKFNVNEPRSGGGGTWRAQTVSPEMVTEQQLNHNWRTGGYNYQHDSDETTSTSSEDRLEQGCVPMGSITKEPPPWRKRRTTDDIISEPPMKKPHTSDYVAVKQEHANDVKQEDQGGGFFRCSQTHDNPQAPWLTSLHVGEVLSFLFCKSPQSASVVLCIRLVKHARQRTARYITRKRPPIRA